jgi:hypothetical protein
VKVEHVKEQKLGLKIDLQKSLKVERVKEGSTLDIQIQIVNWIYN